MAEYFLFVHAVLKFLFFIKKCPIMDIKGPSVFENLFSVFFFLYYSSDFSIILQKFNIRVINDNTLGLIESISSDFVSENEKKRERSKEVGN